MKRKMITVIAILMLVFPISIKAASATASGPASLQVGENSAITLKTTTASNMNGTVKITGNSVELITDNRNYNAGNFYLDTGESIKVKAVRAGETTITFEGVGYEEATGNSFNISTSIKIKVVNKPSGGSNGGGSTAPKPPVKDDTEGEKAGNTLTEEQKKKAEEERKKQEIEALKKVPLIKEVKISSDADKMNGELLTTINPTDNMFDYSYQLPRKVDKAIIEVPAVEGVTLTYDKNVAFSEGEASKVVEIKAVKGEIEQVFKITLTNDITPDVIRDVTDKSLTVYQDERASVFFKTLGLETVIPENPLIGSVFENEHLKLQLLINEKEEAQFYLLDNEYEIVEPVSVIKGSDEMIVAVQNSNEITQESIRGQKQVTKEHDSVVTLEDIDSQINIKKTTTYWEIEDGDIFYGTSSTGIENTFIVDKELGFSNILVSFDQINNQQTNIIIGLSVALITIVSTNIVYISTHIIKKRRLK